MTEPLLKAEGIVKDFPGVRAVDHVGFELQPGEVHCLVGENGAGKSTLIKIFVGAHKPEQGRLFLQGQEAHFSTTREAYLHGIAAVFQEFNLIPVLNIAQNIFLGREPRQPGTPFTDESRLHADAKKLLETLSLDLDTHKPIETLGVAQKQMVEIAKALSMKANILIMDEPTAALTNQEIEQLFKQIALLKERGVGIIYISHRLEEVFRLGDRVTVMRDGKKVGTWATGEVTMQSLINAMVAREIDRLFPRDFVQPGQVALRVNNLERAGVLHDINLSARYGEIVGVAGLVGAGRTELMRAIFGADPVDAGTLEVDGRTVEFKQMSPEKAIGLGIGMLPESRKEDGLALLLPLSDNIILASLAKLFPRFFVSGSKQRKVAEGFIVQLRIAARSVQQLAGSLSGGTQQKVVLSKWLCSKSRILLFDEPTRGIDV